MDVDNELEELMGYLGKSITALLFLFQKICRAIIVSYIPILCPRLGAEGIGRILWQPRAPLGPIFMTGLPER